MDRLLTTKWPVEFIENMGQNDKITVVLFDSYAFYTLGFTNDKAELKLDLQRIRSSGGTTFDSALGTSMNLFDRSIFNSEIYIPE